MGKRIWLLPEQGTFYKANLHTHTVVSNGKLTPEEMKREYQKRGYSVIAYTDHRVYRNHTELNDNSFIALTSCEVDIDGPYKTPGDYSRVQTYHINLYDTRPDYEVERKLKSIMPECECGDMDGINRYLEEMKELDFLAYYNHPYWSLQTYDNYKDLKGLWGMEIFNYSCEHDGLCGYHPQSYDELLRLGNHLYCVAGDDNHNLASFDDPLCDSFGEFTCIKAGSLTYEHIIDSLKNGHFCCSMGPEIEELYIEDGELVMKCSPVEKIYVKTEGRGYHKKLAPAGETIREARFRLGGTEGYIRVDCRDSHGRHANSNAWFLDR